MPKNSKKSSDEPSPTGQKVAAGCVALFGLPFAAGGLLALWLIAASLSNGVRMQSWVETPATILEAKFDAETDSDGATTGRAKARYQYTFAGRKYEATRVAVDQGADNVGKYQEQRAAELEEILKNKAGKFRCFVNPNDSSEAVLFREVRWGLQAFKAMFAVAFGGVGFGILAAVLFGVGKSKKQNKIKEANPDKPWLWREDWAAGRIRSSAKMLWLATGFAGLWNAISWPLLLLFATQEHIPDRRVFLVVGLFPLVGVGLAAWAGYQWLQRLRWGVSELELAAVPGVLGGALGGVIHVPRSVTPIDGYSLRLACLRTVTEGSGDNRSSREDVVWEREKKIVRDLSGGAGGRTAIPVQFLIPYDLPDSSEENVCWRLKASAETVGVDYSAEFEVPVYKTSASSRKQAADNAESDALAPYEAAPDLATAARRMGAIIERDVPGGRTLLFPMTRNLGMSSFLVIFTVVWTAIGVAFLASKAPRIVGWGILAFDLMLVPMTIATCFRRTRISFGLDGLTIDSRVLGFGQPRLFSPGEIERITVERSGTTSGSTTYQKIVLRARTGKDDTVVSEIAHAADAELLAREMREGLGLSPAGLSEKRTATGSERISLDAELPPDLRAE